MPAGLLLAACAVLTGCGSSSPAAARAAAVGSAACPVPVPGVGALPAPASAWPTASYSARRDSGTPATGPQTGLVRWRRDLGAPVVTGPVVGVDGTVVVADSRGVVHGLDPRTGADRFRTPTGQAGGTDLSASPAVLRDGTLLVPGAAGALVALDRSGHERWRLAVGTGQLLSPAVAGAGRVYAAATDGTLAALTPDAGGPHLRWRTRVGSPALGSPAVRPDGVVLVTAGRALVAVSDQGDRAVVCWRSEARADVEVSPAVAPDGTGVLGTNSDAERGVRADGTPAWAYPKLQWTYSSPVVRSGTAVFGDDDGRVYEVDTATGRGRVLVPTAPGDRARDSRGVGVWTAPVVDARGDVYAGTAAGRLRGWDATGRRLLDLDLGGYVAGYPALDADGALYATSAAGTVVAVAG